MPAATTTNPRTTGEAMWLNGGYYYRGMIYMHPGPLAALVMHLDGPPPPPHRTDDDCKPEDCDTPEYSHWEEDWQPVFTFLEYRPPRGKRLPRGHSGEDWPQPIGTWDAIIYPHRAGAGMCIPSADDARRERDLCQCVGKMDGQHPDCTLPGWRQVNYRLYGFKDLTGVTS